MHHRFAAIGGCVALGLAPGALSRQAVPVRQMEAPSAVSAENFGMLFGVHEYADGRVLVNDAGRRRLLLFDSALTRIAVVADSTRHYDESASQIIPYVGDSVLFVNYASRGFLMVDPEGRVGRAVALPKAGDLLRITGSRVIVDQRGRLVYRGVFPRDRAAAGGREPGTYVTQVVDSAPIVRADFETRTVDTLGVVRMPNPQTTYRSVSTSGEMTYKVVARPVSIIDDWTLTSDGRVAIVRGLDYHIDWIAGDNTRTSSQKMPFDWKAITEDEKRRLADSARASQQAMQDESKARRDSAGPPRLPPGAVSVGVTFSMRIDPASGTTISIPDNAAIVGQPIDEMPTYYPPIRPGAAIADRDGNVWILPATSAQSNGGGLVYDVVNRDARLSERVQLPRERSIAGFGRNGRVYLMWRDTAKTWHLERAMVGRGTR